MGDVPVPTITINVLPPDEERNQQVAASPCATFSSTNTEMQHSLFNSGDFSSQHSPTGGFIHDPNTLGSSFGLSHDMTTALRHSQFPLQCVTSNSLMFDPLSDASGELFLSPDHQLEMASDRSSPIDMWSPISSSSGELFTDNASEYSSTGQDISYPSSRSHSPHSPLAFNLSLDDGTHHDQFQFDSNAPLVRNRSSSFNGRMNQDPQNSSDSRPRSASVCIPPARPELSLDVLLPFAQASTPDFYHSALPSYETESSIGSPIPGLNVMMSPMSPQDPSLPPSPTHGRSASWGGTDSFNPAGFNVHPNAEFLQVPNNVLQRRNAHRRSISHAESIGRGRSRDTVPIGGSFQHHTHGRSADFGFPVPEVPSADANMYMSGMHPEPNYSQFLDADTQLDTDMFNIHSDGYSSDSSYSGHPSPSSSAYSPSIASAHSPTPSFASTSSSSNAEVFDFNFSVVPPDPDDAGTIGRRNTYTPGLSSPSRTDHDPPDLQRARSDPSPSRGAIAPKQRRRTRQNQRGSVAGMTGVFRSELPLGALAASPGEMSGSSTVLTDVRGPSHVPVASTSTSGGSGSRASSQDPPFKKTVASKKICAAAKKRRKNGDAAGAHVCPQCGQDFTTKHNLNYHMDSHAGEKKYECQFCGQKSVHPHVIKRHIQNSCKQKPEGYLP